MKTITKPIEMISWTEKDGKIHPLRFKIEANDGQQVVYKIRKIYTRDIDKIAGNQVYCFTCEIVANNTLRICELRYNLNSCCWYLFKL
ncbi:hypothetical protein QBE53_14085 [Vallitaleaceae bacterium 9-2]